MSSAERCTEEFLERGRRIRRRLPLAETQEAICLLFDLADIHERLGGLTADIRQRRVHQDIARHVHDRARALVIQDLQTSG